MPTTAEVANELNYRNGYDYDPAFEQREREQEAAAEEERRRERQELNLRLAAWFGIDG